MDQSSSKKIFLLMVQILVFVGINSCSPSYDDLGENIDFKKKKITPKKAMVLKYFPKYIKRPFFALKRRA